MQNNSTEKVITQLENTNKKLDVIIGIMNKPESRFGKILETAGAVVSIFGILSIIDIIRYWLGF
jgi:hypothetical protein